MLSCCYMEASWLELTSGDLQVCPPTTKTGSLMSWPWKGASRTAKIPILFIFKQCRRKYISKHWGQIQLWRTPFYPEWSNRSPWTLTQDCVCSILLLLFAEEECEFIKRNFRILSHSILTLKTLLRLGLRLRLHFIAPFGLTPSLKFRFTFNNKRILQVKSLIINILRHCILKSLMLRDWRDGSTT